MTYRPGKVEREPDGIRKSFQDRLVQIYIVSSQHGRHDVSKCTTRGRVNLHLIVFQAHAKRSPARRPTEASPFTTTTLPKAVFPEVIRK